ncbi:MAG: TonB-dependent receptor [Steroidobacteraceae bacterium]
MQSVSSSVRRALAPGLAVFASLAVAPIAAAESPADSVGEVVVVATRSPVAIEKIGSSVTVIDAEELRESQAVVLSDALVRTPGITLSRNGGPGSVTSVRIRGAEADQTLVLIDGVQLNDPSSTGGGFDFGNLLVGDIERVEILRGPQSTLYGSQAIGGVVNIVTRESTDELTTNLSAEAGSRNSSLLEAGVGGRFDKVTLRLAGARYRTDGVSAFDAGTETDPFTNTTLAGRFGYAFTPSVSLDLRGYFADGKVNYDGFPPPFYIFADEGDYALTRQRVGYAGLNFALLDGRLLNRVAVQSTDTHRGLFLSTPASTIGTGIYDGENRRYEYQGTFLLSPSFQAVFGLQHERSEMSSDSSPASAEVDLKSAYLQLQAEVLRGLTLTAGGRLDDHETFGSNGTGQFAAAWALDSRTILRASWSQGFKAPTLYQLYSDLANPALEPEKSRGWDAGVEQHFLDGRAMLSATWFHRRTTNQISYANCPFPLSGPCALPGHSTFGYYLNTARSRAQGLELQGRIDVTDALSIDANYTQMSSTDQSPGSLTRGQRLLRRPDTSANATVSYRWPARVTTSVAARYSSAGFDENFDVFPSVRVALSAYTLVDLRAAWQLSDWLTVAGRVENLFDEDYRTVFQYGTLGRTGFVSLEFNF